MKSIWPVDNLGNFVEQIRGVSYKKSEAQNVPATGKLPLLRANNISESGINFNELVYVPTDRIKPHQKLKKFDLVIAASSGSIHVVGKAAQVLNDWEGAFGAFCKVLRPKKEIAPRYLAFYFQTKYYRTVISKLAAGANINNLKNEHFDDLNIPLPPLSIQRKIAAVLDRADGLRRVRRAAIDTLDRLTQSVFLDMFGDPATNPKGWDIVGLRHLIGDGPQNGLYKPSKDYGSGVSILRIDSFYDGKVTNLENLKRVNISEKEVKTYDLSKDDIVINRVNSRKFLGKCAIIPELKERTVYESNMMRFSVKRERVNPHFAAKMLSSNFVRNQILKRAKDAVNQSSINQQDVLSFEIPVPPIELQQKYECISHEIDVHKDTMKKNYERLDNLFHSLLQRAFKGELAFNDEVME